MSRSTTRAVVTASWAVVGGRLLVPVVAACLLLAATLPALDDVYGLMALHGVGVLLATAWVVAMDNPMG